LPTAAGISSKGGCLPRLLPAALPNKGSSVPCHSSSKGGGPSDEQLSLPPGLVWQLQQQQQQQQHELLLLLLRYLQQQQQQQQYHLLHKAHTMSDDCSKAGACGVVWCAVPARGSSTGWGRC